MADDLRARALRSYERGQLRAALALSAWIVPLSALATQCCQRRPEVAAIGVASFALCTYLAWRGGVMRVAVGAGLKCGAVAMAMPLLVTLAGVTCSPEHVDPRVIVFCVAGGLAAGAAVAWRARGLAERQGTFLVVACGIALLLGSMGCMIAGLGGVLGMLAGGVLASTPALARMALGRG